MQNREWKGIANGAGLSVADKRAARRGHEVPDRVETAMQRALGPTERTLRAWQKGLIDIRYHGGEALLSMTGEQAGLWQQARGGSRT